jgi:nucleotide-binding universal stress UspA family protein
LIGTDEMNLLRKCPCPVWLIKCKRSRSFRRILAALLGEVSDVVGPFGCDDPLLKTHLVRGSARREIPALAKRLDADLVVMGTVGRTGIPGLLMGNTAETILQQVECSVLAIKPPGFVTPVTLEA